MNALTFYCAWIHDTRLLENYGHAGVERKGCLCSRVFKEIPAINGEGLIEKY